MLLLVYSWDYYPKQMEYDWDFCPNFAIIILAGLMIKSKKAIILFIYSTYALIFLNKVA